MQAGLKNKKIPTEQSIYGLFLREVVNDLYIQVTRQKDIFG